MQFITKEQIVIFNTLLTKVGKARGQPFEKREKADYVLAGSNGRTDTTTGLYLREAQKMISDLKAQLGQPQDKSGEVMRRNIIAMAHEMNWELPGGKIDMKRVNRWVANYGYLNKTKHTLNEYNDTELPKLVTQFKSVYQSYLKGVK